MYQSPKDVSQEILEETTKAMDERTSEQNSKTMREEFMEIYKRGSSIAKQAATVQQKKPSLLRDLFNAAAEDTSIRGREKRLLRTLDQMEAFHTKIRRETQMLPAVIEFCDVTAEEGAKRIRGQHVAFQSKVYDVTDTPIFRAVAQQLAPKPAQRAQGRGMGAGT
jgi:hypothetical protein